MTKHNIFSKEELPTTIFGLIVLGLMAAGVVYLDFESLNTIIQLAFFGGAGLGIYLVCPEKVRNYFKFIPKIKKKLE